MNQEAKNSTKLEGMCVHGNFAGSCEACQENIDSGLQPKDYYSSSLDQLFDELKNRKISVDLEPTFVGNKCIINGESIRSAHEIQAVQKKAAIAILHETDFRNQGINSGDEIDFTSVRGNKKQLKFTGKIDHDGIWVEVDQDGEKKELPYKFNSINSYQKAS